ncbi:hypothetical protein ACXYTP_25430 [Tsukamurella ocularis]
MSKKVETKNVVILAKELDALPTGAAVLMHSNLDGSDSIGLIAHFRNSEYDQIHFARNAESLAAHLLNILPPAVDPVHQVASLIARKAES